MAIYGCVFIENASFDALFTNADDQFQCNVVENMVIYLKPSKMVFQYDASQFNLQLNA